MQMILQGHRNFTVKSFGITIIKTSFKLEKVKQWSEVSEKYEKINNNRIRTKILDLLTSIGHKNESGESIIKTSFEKMEPKIIEPPSSHPKINNLFCQ